jgi:hypothetical protein
MCSFPAYYFVFRFALSSDLSVVSVIATFALAVSAVGVVVIIAIAIAVAVTVAVAIAIAFAFAIIINASHCAIYKIPVAVCKCIAILTDVLHWPTHLEVREVTLPQIEVSWKGTILNSIYFLTVPPPSQ